MKLSIAVAALGLVLAGAHAPAEGFEIIGSTENDAGGEMLITDQKCGAKGKEKGRAIMSTNAGGVVVLHGCAHPLPPGRVFIEWNRGTTSILPMSAWAPNATTPLGLRSLSDADLETFRVRLAWFEESRNAQPARQVHSARR